MIVYFWLRIWPEVFAFKLTISFLNNSILSLHLKIKDNAPSMYLWIIQRNITFTARETFFLLILKAKVIQKYH